MKLDLKHIYMGTFIAISGLSIASCNDFLDREPLTSVTPEVYFQTADQVGAYVLNYYQDNLIDSRSQSLFHPFNWRSGTTVNDDQTDNLLSISGNLSYFAGNKEVPSGKTLQGALSRARVWNWFFEKVLPKEKEGSIQGDAAEISQYIGEAYFFRAMSYYFALVRYGDFPIITEVLPDEAPILKEKSIRTPRNEVARFILSDLDQAIGRLHEQGYANNQRINKQVAQLFKSRVALFEATFEKYHRGTGRVPGDDTWPGKNMPYNQGKTFDIPGEIDFFLTEAMNASKAVADHCQLTENSHVMNPELGQISGWNPYFEMYGSTDLSKIPEVLLWKEYSGSLNGATHDAPYILSCGGDHLGLTHSYITSFLMKNGLPWYANGSGYKGDTSVSLEKEGRDERLQLFVFGEKDVHGSDLKDPAVAKANAVTHIDTLRIISESAETRDLTGYRPRKYYSYDFNQYYATQQICTTGAVVFRAGEAYLNYIEACYEKNHSLDNTATNYWKAIRRRAGVSEDLAETDRNTDLDKEANIISGTVYGDLAVYSGDQKVDVTLYNIRRERRCEFISEGMRWDDLKRWRSWDLAITGHYMLEGMNLWDEAYKTYVDKDGKSTVIADGTTNANVSPKEISKYLRPMGLTKTNNELYDGYTWRKAFYLEPIGTQDLSLTATDPTNVSTSTLYQNPYWPMTPGKSLE